MSSSTLVEIVQALYSAMATGDTTIYDTALHADFRVVESPALPFGGTFNGMEGFNALVGQIFEMYSEFIPQPKNIAVGGNQVMVEVDIRLTGKATGKTIDTQLIEVFTFENDKLIEIKPYYFDTDLLASIL